MSPPSGQVEEAEGGTTPQQSWTPGRQSLLRGCPYALYLPGLEDPSPPDLGAPDCPVTSCQLLQSHHCQAWPGLA